MPYGKAGFDEQGKAVRCRPPAPEENEVKFMERKTLSVPTITCGHCVMTIKRELGEMRGVSRVEGDPGAKSITVEWGAPATLEAIKATLREINYPAAE
jgi:copper chaperone